MTISFNFLKLYFLVLCFFWAEGWGRGVERGRAHGISSVAVRFSSMLNTVREAAQVVLFFLSVSFSDPLMIVYKQINCSSKVANSESRNLKSDQSPKSWNLPKHPSTQNAHCILLWTQEKNEISIH